jgi:RHS repeat-associated protein
VEYDFAGNVTSDAKFRGLRYAYDANGRMTRASLPDGTQVAAAVYDALGQRVQTTTGGNTRVMVYDVAGRVVAEYGQADAGVGGLRYVFSDHQGSARVSADAQGQVKSRRDYEPYGGELAAGLGRRTGAQGYDAPDGSRPRFAQTERDAETGLDHTWWRKYESRGGRWTSPDPYLGSMSAGDPQSFNRYSYVQNDPVNFIDPSGLHLGSFNLGLALAGCSLVGYDDKERPLYFCWNNYDPAGGAQDAGRQRGIDDTIYDIGQIFSGDSDCTRFFGGMEVAPYILQRLELQPGSLPNRDVGIQMTFPTTADGAYQNVQYRRPSTSGVVNTDGPFYSAFYPGTSDRRPNVGPYRAGTAQARVLMVLHEMAHMIRPPGGTGWLIPNDGPLHPNYPNQSRENTQTVHDVCGDEIDFVTGG